MVNRDFKWMNECHIEKFEDSVNLLVPDKTDLFCALDGKSVVCNAPFYYTELNGNCVIRARVSMENKGCYDGVGLLIYSDETHWIKGCLEVVDNGKIAAISVATNQVSDDAIGPYIVQDSIWLQVSRKEEECAVHFSIDGKEFELIRFCHIPMKKEVKVGIVGQAPLGKGGLRKFNYISVEEKSLANLRTGI